MEFINKKVFISILTILILLSGCLYGQRVQGVSGIEYTLLEIKKDNSDAIHLEDAQGTLIQKFGTPTSSKPYYYEMDEIMAKKIEYGNNEFYESSNGFDAFFIRSNTFQLGINNKFIMVGDNINEVSRMYVDADRYKSGAAFYIPLIYQNEKLDGVFLVIYFNPETYEVTGMHIYES
ncbi:MAG: hypothetical protein WBA74_21725 [Cyclobacteriaceae bacterium]